MYAHFPQQIALLPSQPVKNNDVSEVTSAYKKLFLQKIELRKGFFKIIIRTIFTGCCFQRDDEFNDISKTRSAGIRGHTTHIFNYWKH
jgi:hypothetical protein